MSLFLIGNSVMQTTAVAVAVTTGTAIKTMLQVRPLVPLRIVEWGISFNASALATPIVVELVETGTVFATVTALAEADIQKVNDPAALAATVMTLSTTGTGFTASAEGTITATRNLDATMFISGLSQPFIKQFPLGTEPVSQVGNSTRIRVTAPAAVNCYCYIKLGS
jgi:hypothetical protein